MIKLLFNISLIVIWTIYFSFYYSFDYNPIWLEFFSKFNWWAEAYSIANWLIAFFLVYWIISIITQIFELIFHKFFTDNLFSGFIIKVISITKYFIGLNAFLYFAIVPAYFHDILTQIYSIGIIIIVLISITTIINNVFKYRIIKNPNLKIQPEFRTLLPFINKTIITIIWVLWIISIFSNLGYNVNAFIAWAWIWGLAIAFAAQKSISQIFWAIIIFLNKPFKVWDYIKINWMVWTVKSIWLTYIELTERAWHKVMIPNDVSMSTNIENYTERKNRRTEVILQIEYKTPSLKIQKWEDAIKNILQFYVDNETISSYRVTFDSFGKFSLDINILYYSLHNADISLYAKQKEEINYEIKKAFEKIWIKMAFPNQELFNIMWS